MAYDIFEPPEFVIGFGGLPISDVFRYFKEALLYHPTDYSGDLEKWPIYVDNDLYTIFKIFGDIDWPVAPGVITSDTPMPINRQQFYDYIDGYSVGLNLYAAGGEFSKEVKYFNFFSTVSGQKLYEMPEIIGGSEEVIRAWGKVKSCELGLFGNVTNGSGLSDESIIKTGTLRQSIENWKICDLNYLRCAMIYLRFPGDCFTNPVIAPSPTNLIVNTSNRTFTWSNPPGYTDSQHYYILNGEMFNVTSKPVPLGNNTIYPGDLEIYTRGGGYESDSFPLTNTATIVQNNLTATVNIIIPDSSSNEARGVFNFNFITETDLFIRIVYRYNTISGPSEPTNYIAPIPKSSSFFEIDDILLLDTPGDAEPTLAFIDDVLIIPLSNYGLPITPIY